jgi:hypothetical protein
MKALYLAFLTAFTLSATAQSRPGRVVYHVNPAGANTARIQRENASLATSQAAQAMEYRRQSDANAAADSAKQAEWYCRQGMIALHPWIVDQEWMRLDALERSLREVVFRDTTQIALLDGAGLEASVGRARWAMWRDSAFTKLRKANSDKIKREGEVRLWKAGS